MRQSVEESLEIVSFHFVNFTRDRVIKLTILALNCWSLAPIPCELLAIFRMCYLFSRWIARSLITKSANCTESTYLQRPVNKVIKKNKIRKDRYKNLLTSN